MIFKRRVRHLVQSQHSDFIENTIKNSIDEELKERCSRYMLISDPNMWQADFNVESCAKIQMVQLKPKPVGMLTGNDKIKKILVETDARTRLTAEVEKEYKFA